MSNITLRLTDEEREILNNVAHLYGDKLSTAIKTILFEKIEEPRSKGKALVGNLKDYWRYRIGDYRLITKIDDGKLLIITLELKHRKEVYE